MARLKWQKLNDLYPVGFIVELPGEVLTWVHGAPKLAGAEASHKNDPVRARSLSLDAGALSVAQVSTVTFLDIGNSDRQ
jgi:hypothetical protein